MTDYFALFQEARRPWIDPESLKGKFLALSAEVHPDRVHGAPEAQRLLANQCYSELNAAYNCLRAPKDRLLHLIELEQGTKPTNIQRTPSEMMDLFMNVGETLRGADAFLRDKAKVTSPLLKVQWFERGMDWTEKLQHLQRVIHTHRNALDETLKSMNADWTAAPEIGSSTRREALPLDRLEHTYRQLSYFHRWTSQIQERITQLSF
jgi:DnaJ-domain-containing protein 1